MKKTIIIGFITILLILFLQPVCAFAEELSPEAEISSQFNDILSDYDIQQNTEDISGLSFGGFITAVKQSAAYTFQCGCYNDNKKNCAKKLHRNKTAV